MFFFNAHVILAYRETMRESLQKAADFARVWFLIPHRA